MEGINGKKRFTIYIPGLGQVRFGTCDERDDDRRDLIYDNGEYYLVHYPKESYNLPAMGKFALPKNTLVANGWYDEEHINTGGFFSLKDFQWK